MLQIAIHRNDVLAASMIEPGRQRRGLAKITTQLDHRNPAIHGCNFAKQIEGAVTRAVVNQHDLKALTIYFHDRLQTVIQIGDILLLVVQGDDDGIFGQALIIRNELDFCPPVKGRTT